VVILASELNFSSFVDDCQVHSDCPFDKACVSHDCVDPCLNTICGTRAVCNVKRHTAICECPRPLQGNPLIACVESGCASNSDCAGNEICGFPRGVNFIRKECQPLCQPGKCTLGAKCDARDHREFCICQPPLRGDGYVSCAERKFL
jgi:hypothetical protein